MTGMMIAYILVVITGVFFMALMVAAERNSDEIK